MHSGRQGVAGHAYNLEGIAANIRPWNLLGNGLRKKNRDHPHSITTTFRECRIASPEAILGQCWRTTLPLRTTRASRPEKAHGRSGASMNHPIQACFRSSAAVVARQTFMAPLLTALAAIAAVSDSASAQTAFTLPAPPPFELPIGPSLSGNWTVMGGVG